MKIKSLRTLVTALGAVCFLTVAALASDASGSWTWSSPGRNGGAPRVSKLTLVAKDGVLTGTLAGGRGAPIEISDGTVKDDAIAFTANVTMRDNTIAIKYTGKVTGDTITGSIEVPGRDGGDPMKRDWTATRAKPGAAPAPAAAPAAPAPAPAT